MTPLWTEDNSAVTPDYALATTTLSVTGVAVVCWEEGGGGGDVGSYHNWNS